MIPRSLPTRTLAERPDLDQLKRQAKELLDAFRAQHPEAVAEVTAHYHAADSATFALHDAQLVIARAYGFQSWPKLKAYVEGVTAQRFHEAVRTRDSPQVRAMLQARPELAGSGLHIAVINREPELVRVLVQHGANARVDIYPHRDATSPLTVATERGYDEIVAIIREEERTRQLKKSGVASPADELFEAMRRVRYRDGWRHRTAFRVGQVADGLTAHPSSRVRLNSPWDSVRGIHLDILGGRAYRTPPRMSTKRRDDRIELLQGTLDLLVLRTLRLGPAHGHAIAKAIERGSEDVLQVEQGSLYPALHRLIKRGWIASMRARPRTIDAPRSIT